MGVDPKLLEEYRAQQGFRNWNEILSRIPSTGTNCAVDLGCGTGYVTRLLRKRYAHAIGIDLDGSLLGYAQDAHRECSFVHADFETLDYQTLGTIDLFFSAFSLAYVKHPGSVLNRLRNSAAHGGRIVVLEIDRMFSRHLSEQDPFYERVLEFEKASERSGGYNFVCGSKLQEYFLEAGIPIEIKESSVFDRELNFVGACAPDVLSGWKMRFARMTGLRQHMGDKMYQEFSEHFLNVISSSSHSCAGAVQMIISCPCVRAESGG